MLLVGSMRAHSILCWLVSFVPFPFCTYCFVSSSGKKTEYTRCIFSFHLWKSVWTHLGSYRTFSLHIWARTCQAMLSMGFSLRQCYPQIARLISALQFPLFTVGRFQAEFHVLAVCFSFVFLCTPIIIASSQECYAFFMFSNV